MVKPTFNLPLDAAGVTSRESLNAEVNRIIDVVYVDKAETNHTHPASQISDSTSAGRALLTAANPSAQRTALGLGTAATTASSDYAAAVHTHAIANVTGLQTALEGITAKTNQLTVTAPVNLDTMSARINDLDAAVVLRGSWSAAAGTFPGGGTAQAGSSWIVSVSGTVGGIAFLAGDRIVAITDNASTTVYAGNWLHLDYTDQVSSVNARTGAVVLSKSDVGLANADDTSDAAKPVSVAQEARISKNEVTRHGAPLKRSLVRTGSGSYVLNPELDPMGADDGFGPLFSRAIYRHGAPISGDLVRGGAGQFLRRSVADDSAIGWVAGGEGWIALADNAWPISDGASSGGPSVLAVDARGNTVIARNLPYPEYLPNSVKSARFVRSGWPFLPSVRRVVAICYHGQSQAVGTNFATINLTPLNPGRAAMFIGGPRLTQFLLYPDQESAADYVADGGVFAGLSDLRELPVVRGLGESPMTSLCSNILAHLPADTGVIAINAAVGGQPIEKLRRGSAGWHNLAVALGEARRYCAERGVAFEVGGLFWSQGGANASDTTEAYAEKFRNGIYDPWSDLMQAHGFSAHEVPVFINGMTHNNLNDLAVARAALLLHDDPVRNIVAVGPEYLYTSCNDEGLGSGTNAFTNHISAEGTIHRAYFEGLAYKAVRVENGEWQPLRMVSAVRSGASVTINLNLGAANVTGPPIINSAAIAAVANAGFSWIDNGDGNAVSITGVSVGAGGQLTLTLSATPTGTGQRIGYALTATAVTNNWQGPVNGSRGSVCDSATGTLTINGKSYSPRLHLHTDIINVSEV